jgi:steroid delta-isomerase-like uncharacterized protein
MKSTAIASSEGQKSQAEMNKEFMRLAVEKIWNGGDYDSLEEFVSPDFVVHLSPEQRVHGIEGVKNFYTGLRKSFPDIHFEIEEIIAEGDRVVTQWRATGTHRGEFRGIPPTGKKFTLTAVDIDRIVDGKTVECWTKMDELGLMNQLKG